MNSLLNVNTTLLACMLLAEYYGNHLLNLGRHSRCVFALLHPRNLKIKPEPRKTLNKKRKKRKQVARSWSPRYFFLSPYLFLAPLPATVCCQQRTFSHPNTNCNLSLVFFACYSDTLYTATHTAHTAKHNLHNLHNLSEHTYFLQSLSRGHFFELREE